MGRQHNFGGKQSVWIGWGLSTGSHMAVGQHQWYHFGVGAPPILVIFSGHWGYGLLSHGHMVFVFFFFFWATAAPSLARFFCMDMRAAYVLGARHLRQTPRRQTPRRQTPRWAVQAAMAAIQGSFQLVKNIVYVPGLKGIYHWTYVGLCSFFQGAKKQVEGCHHITWG